MVKSGIVTPVLAQRDGTRDSILRLRLENEFGEFVCICILAEMRVNFGWDVHFGMHI